MLSNKDLKAILNGASENIDDWKTIGTKIIVQVEKLEQGFIHLTDDALRKEQDRITEGVLLQSGPLAFCDLVNTKLPFYDQIPIPNDIVNFVTFAGKGVSLDEKEFRVIHDEDVFLFLRRDEDGK